MDNETQPQAIQKKRGYQWWRPLIWILASVGMVIISINIPLQTENPYKGQTITNPCGPCSTHVNGFPIPWREGSTNLYNKSSWLMTTAHAQLTIDQSLGTCFDGCETVGEVVFWFLGADFFIYLFTLIFIDVLVYRKQNKKYYYYLFPIFLLYILVGSMITVDFEQYSNLHLGF